MNHIRLLLADKNLSYLEIARKMLQFQNEGYEVDVATSGEECLQRLDRHQYDLLLLDYDIDDKKGLEILARVVQAHPEVPVVMLIDEQRKEIALKAIDLGAYDYIMKVRGYLTALPFTVHKVLEKRKIKVPEVPAEEEPVAAASEPVLEMAEEMAAPEEKHPAQEATYILDRKGRFISSNRELEERLNYTEDELLELTLGDLMPPDQESAYYRWLASIDLETDQAPFRTELIGKHGVRQFAEVFAAPMRNRHGDIINYKGKIKFNGAHHEVPRANNGYFDQMRMINDLVELIGSSHDNSFSYLLERISQSVCQLFQFKRATLALLDRRRKSFVKQIMIGFTDGKDEERRILEVPQDVIERIFSNQYKVKVVYHNQELDDNHSHRPAIGEKRSHFRPENNHWHPQDIVIFNLTDRSNRTIGYISLDEPIHPVVPSREIFYNMEIFTNLASLAIENYYRFASLEKSNRRLKQLLVTSDLFKIHLRISEMMKEIVWAIKFSMEYNVVLLGLISRQSRNLEIKAVACDDRIKSIQLKEISLPISALQSLLQKEYRQGKSYFVNRTEPALRKLKDVYYDRKIDVPGHRYWPWWALLMVPIYDRNAKIIGFIMVDDPSDALIPTKEEIRTLEILANQIAVAIENRLTYLQIRERLRDKKESPAEYSRIKSEKGIKKLVDYFFK